MEKMLSLDEKARALLGQNGRAKVVREFDEKFVIDKYVQAIAQVDTRPVLSRLKPNV
jgi:hypothetical protein